MAGSTAERSVWAPSPSCRYGGLRLVAKRLLDLTVAIPMLVASAPLLAMVSLAVRVDSGGPVLYRQVRVGRHGRRFTILKFRTMHIDADSRLRSDPDLWRRYLDGGFKLSLEEDPRVTRIGALLRKTSLDELPQLLNVIRGDMSMVGPRPVIPEELEQYGRLLPAYLMASPGLTGAWQVAGRDAVRFPGRAQLDADYVERWSLAADIGIIMRTVPAAISARDVR
ncbi:MAG: sugar transferase [Actinomycetota bacterium]